MTNNITFEEIYKQYKSVGARACLHEFRRYGFAISRLYPIDGEEDLISEFWLKVSKYHHTFDNDKSDLKTWLITVAKSVAITLAQKGSRQKRAINAQQFVDSPDQVINAQHDMSDNAPMRDFYEALSQESQLFFTLYCEYGCTLGSIKDILQVSQSKVNKSMAKLRTETSLYLRRTR